MSDERRCEFCDGLIIGRRAHARFCSEACKTAAWRERRQSVTEDETQYVRGYKRKVPRRAQAAPQGVTEPSPESVTDG